MNVIEKIEMLILCYFKLLEIDYFNIKNMKQNLAFFKSNIYF